MKFATVILAGGEGTRMGGGKPLRMLSERTLLDRALAFGKILSGPIAVAIGHKGQFPVQDAELVLDEPSVVGPLSGLIAGLRFATQSGVEALLTIPVDMPFLPDDLPARLASALPGNGAAIAGSGGELHPVCGMWRLQTLDAIPNYLATGRRSLKGFAEAVGYAAVEWTTKPFDPFLNINSPRDLELAEKLLGG